MLQALDDDGQIDLVTALAEAAGHEEAFDAGFDNLPDVAHVEPDLRCPHAIRNDL